jgi:hypothetical protein
MLPQAYPLWLVTTALNEAGDPVHTEHQLVVGWVGRYQEDGRWYMDPVVALNNEGVAVVDSVDHPDASGDERSFSLVPPPGQFD